MTTEPTTMEQATALARTHSAGRNWRDRFWQTRHPGDLGHGRGRQPLSALLALCDRDHARLVHRQAAAGADSPSNPTLDNITNLIR
jgi:hypothetical protein